jgi:chemotaxis protein MotA
LDNVKNAFFRKGLKLVVDGTESRAIREILEIDMENEEERGESAAKFYEAAGAYAPTIGILGAVLGLIHVMENLAEPEKLGEGIAVAFVATVYGVGTANLLWLPIGGKIKLKVKKETTLRELIIEGCVAIAEGDNPHHIRGKLEGFLESTQRDSD